MPANLTETAITAATRRAATSNQRITLSDPGQRGLQLRITPNGTRSWVLYCRDGAGRPRRFPLGAYPEIGIAQGRRAASAMREQVRQGADPIAAARERRAAARAYTPPTDTLRTLIALYGVQRGSMQASGTAGWHRHDLRRTGATMLGELGVEPHIIEAALNHQHIGGQLASLYNRARYRPQVADALQRLADALDGIAAGAAVVVPLRHG